MDGTILSRRELADLLKAKLAPKEEKVIRLAYGIGCERQHSFGEMAQEFGVPQRVMRAIRRDGLHKLRAVGITPQALTWHGERDPLRTDKLLVIPDSRAIVGVTFDFRRVLADTVRDPSSMLDLSPRGFEELVAEIWSRFGYQVELTARTRDGGRDVVAIKQAEASVRFLIECKRFARHRPVGVSLVRELYGVKIHDAATKAFLATTSTFTRDAEQFFDRHRWELESRDYEGVREWARLAQETNAKGPFSQLRLDPCGGFGGFGDRLRIP